MDTSRDGLACDGTLKQEEEKPPLETIFPLLEANSSVVCYMISPEDSADVCL